ncbi:hypothetical protein P170DRAFT_465387 [Aspergillus steynii IBT 23096]|uniref:Uncharacterized protein n=1 Tax=Aspergillus steynii IBT 23096 TaxID=1392250 RepID=A0A2I2G4N1_9EURO|nr:uncharacterized protein P170DRAFT_465387 [Aspergillus steynii IBT 23096]PLB47840.1 hypothetical protein P170DRAFT_465387 [Aspergillus steynii IBT 23096]
MLGGTGQGKEGTKTCVNQEDLTVLTAHQSLLLETPPLAEAVAAFKDSKSQPTYQTNALKQQVGKHAQYLRAARYGPTTTSGSRYENMRQQPTWQTNALKQQVGRHAHYLRVGRYGLFLFYLNKPDVPETCSNS